MNQRRSIVKIDPPQQQDDNEENSFPKKQKSTEQQPTDPEFIQQEFPDLALPEDVEDILDSLPEEQRKVVEKTITTVAMSYSRSSPFPPPSELRAYEELAPGYAQIILQTITDAISTQGKHRRKMARERQREEIKFKKKGQTWAVVFTLLAFAVAVYTIYLGAYLLAGSILGTTVIGLASVFLGTRKSK